MAPKANKSPPVIPQGPVPVTVTYEDDDVGVRPGFLAHVEPLVPAAEAILVHVRRTLVYSGGAGGFASGEEIVPFFDIVAGSSPPSAAVPAGLVPRLVRDLTAGGHTVTVLDERKVTRKFRPDLAGIDPKHLVVREGLAAVADNLIGRVEDEDYERAAWVGDVASLFPRARVLVAVPTKKLAREIVNILNREFDIPARLHGGKAPKGASASVLVCTHQRAGYYAKAGPLVLVLVDAHRAVADGPYKSVNVVLPYARRVYGLVPRFDGLDPLLAHRLTAVTGDLLASNVYGAQPPRVTVRFAKSAGGRVRRTADARERNEAAYWANAARNERVAEVAEAVVENDRAALDRLGIGGAGDQLPIPEYGITVVVVAGTAAQAHALGERLGWPVRTDVPGRRKTGEMTPAGRVVATVAYAAKADLEAGVYVRADGGHGPLLTPWLDKKAVPAKEVTVVDLDDKFDAKARDDTARRAGHYARRGYRFAMTRPAV